MHPTEKNFDTVKYWLDEQAVLLVLNPTEIFYKDNCSSGDHVMMLINGFIKHVADVKWFHVIKDGKDIFIPHFKFAQDFDFLNGNQVNFWISKSFYKGE